MNSEEIATKGDIQVVLNELRLLTAAISSAPNEKEYLRSSEVKRLLGISDSTLQRMRISGALTAKKVGNTWFYKLSDIKRKMQ